MIELRHGIETDEGMPDAVIGSTANETSSLTGPWQFPSSASSRYLTYLVDAVTIQPLFTELESSVQYRETALGLADYWRMFGMNGHSAELDSAGVPRPGSFSMGTVDTSGMYHTTSLQLASPATYPANSNGTLPGAILERAQDEGSTSPDTTPDAAVDAADAATKAPPRRAVYVEVDHIARASPPPLSGLRCFAPVRADEVMPWSAPTPDELAAANTLTMNRFSAPDRRPRVAFAVYNAGSVAAPVAFSLPGNRTVTGSTADLYAVVYGPMPVSVQNEDSRVWVVSYRVAPSFLHKCGATYNASTGRTNYTCDAWSVPAAGSRLFVLALDASGATSLALESPTRGCVNVAGLSSSVSDPSRRILLTTVDQIGDVGPDALSMSARAAREYGLTDYAITASVAPRCGPTDCTTANCDPIDGMNDGQINCGLDYRVTVENDGAQFTGMRPTFSLSGAMAQYLDSDARFTCSSTAPSVTAYATTYRVVVDDPAASTEHTALSGVLDVTVPSGCSCDQFELRPGDTIRGYKVGGGSLGLGHVASRTAISVGNGTVCRLVLDVPLAQASSEPTAVRLQRVVYGDTAKAVSNLNRVIRQVQAGAPSMLVGDQTVPLYPNGADSCPTARHVLYHELGALACPEGDAVCNAMRGRAQRMLWPTGCARPLTEVADTTVSGSSATVTMHCWERRDGVWQQSLDCRLWKPFNEAQRDYYRGYARGVAALAAGVSGDVFVRMPSEMDEDKRLGVNRAPTRDGNASNREFFTGLGMTEAFDIARQVEAADEENPNVQLAVFNTSRARFVLQEAHTIAEQFDPADSPAGYRGIAWVDQADMAYAPPLMRSMLDSLTASAGATMFTPRRVVRSGGYNRAPAFALGERYAVGLHRLNSETDGAPMHTYLWNFYPLSASYDPVYSSAGTPPVSGAVYLRHRDRLGWAGDDPSTCVRRDHAIVLPRGNADFYDESWVGASIYAGYEDYRLGRARRARVSAWRLPPASAFGARDSRHSPSAHTQLSSVVRRDEHSQCMIERALNTDYNVARTGTETPSQTLSRLCRDYY